MIKKHRVLAGIRATGRLHLGNYLGAVKGMLELQDNPDYDTFYMVADIHTITTPHDVEQLRRNRREVVIDYLAAGLDPAKSVIFLQSEIPEHTELAFYFSSVLTIARMQHLPTFKEKVKQYPENASLALLNYPSLMAADILLYKADSVPVGRDQEPHLEVAREVARKMNDIYGLNFPEPVSFKTSGEYVPSLTGDGKMSKSVEGSFINLVDSLEEIKKKVAKIPTDSGRGSIKKDKNKKQKITRYIDQQSDQESTGVGSLMTFVELFQGVDKRKEYEEAYQGKTGLRYGDIKKDLAQSIFKELRPIQERRKKIEADNHYVGEVIQEGRNKARQVAKKTIAEVRQQIGLA